MPRDIYSRGKVRECHLCKRKQSVTKHHNLPCPGAEFKTLLVKMLHQMQE